MSYAYHVKPRVKYLQQQQVTTNYIIPFVLGDQQRTEKLSVLDFGCGEGGVLAAFAQRKDHVVGVDLNEKYIADAKACTDADKLEVEYHSGDFLTEENSQAWCGKFDLIVLKDVIEHLPNKEGALSFLMPLLKKDGKIFISFPNWFMPFGAHQQSFKTKMKYIPYTHYLPAKWFRRLAATFGEEPRSIELMASLYELQVTMSSYRQLVKRLGFKEVRFQNWFLNPIYKYKFGLMPLASIPLLGGIPFFEEIFNTCRYSLIEKK